MKKKDKWICHECGTINDPEYEICFSCGAVRKHIKEPPKKGRGLKIALISLVSLAVIFVLYSAVYHSMAQSAYDEGYYKKAAENAKHDLLFSSDLKESALIDQGKALYDQGKYEEALDVLEPFEDNADAKKYIDLSNKVLAQEACDAGKYDEAIELLEDIDEEILDVTQIRDEAYLGKGIEQLKNTDIEGAVLSFGDIKSNETGKDYYDITQKYISGDFLAASKLAYEYAGYNDNQLSTSEWQAVLEKALEGTSRGDVDGEFEIHAAERMLEEDYDRFAEEEPSYLYYSKPVDQEFEADDYDHTLITADELARCGESDDGKILVLWEIHKYGTSEVEYYIAWDVMEDLPRDLYPESLEEVGRSVRIACYGSTDGWFNVSGSKVYAVREKCNVFAGKGYSGTNAYAKYDIWGDSYPSNQSYWMLVGNDAVFAGISDSVDTYIYNALRKLIV